MTAPNTGGEEEANRRRTLIVGFDALDLRHLDAFDADLPNFRALRDRGTETPLDATFPPWTGSAWPSLYTGVDPSRHGVYSFFDHDGTYPDEADLVSRNSVRAPAIWNYLSERDEPSIVVNVPVTHPAESIDGVLVPGYLASDDAPSQPASVRDELEDVLGEPYRIYADGETSKNRARKADSYADLIDRRGRAAAHLLDTHDWTLGFVQVQKTDTIFHDSPDREHHRQVYEAADEFLGTVLAAVEDDVNVIVCSDHGIGPISGHKVYVNELLEREGFVETASGSSGASLPDAKSDLVGGDDDSDEDPSASSEPGVSARAAAALVDGLHAVNLPPGKLYAAAERVGLGPVVDRAAPKALVESADRGVDWRRSTAYCRSGCELGVRVNLEGREPDGVVPESEYENVRDRLVDVLAELETPSGEPVFEWVARREEVYDGPYADAAPDVVFMPADMNHVIMTRMIGTLFADAPANGHAREGAFVAAGPDIGTLEAESMSLTSVAPIALAAAGLPVPTAMTGTVPDGVVERSVHRDDYGQVAYGSEAVSGDGTDAVEDRLANLGYL